MLGTDEICSARVFLPTGDARLIALDAATGRPCPAFGEGGTVDMKVGMGPINDGWYQQTSNPLVAGDLVVVGGRVADNFAVDEPPGVVRAYSAETGKLVWAWDPGNPDISRYPPEGETYTRGTPNIGAAMSYDPDLGLIYAPTGNTTPDFYAGQRTERDDRYSSAVVALDHRTGRPQWVPMACITTSGTSTCPQPVLTDIPDRQGETVPALIQVTKQGEIFLLDRRTGEPLAEVEERPVPQGNVEGERLRQFVVVTAGGARTSPERGDYIVAFALRGE